MHLLVLLDQPHHLLRGVADLLGRGTEVQQPAQRRRVDLLRAARAAPTARAARASRRAGPRGWLTSAARPWSLNSSARVREADRDLRHVLHLDEHVDGAVEVGEIARVLVGAGRAPLGRAGELAQLGDAAGGRRAGSARRRAAACSSPSGSMIHSWPRRMATTRMPTSIGQLDVGERAVARARSRRGRARGATPLRRPRGRRRARPGCRAGG